MKKPIAALIISLLVCVISLGFPARETRSLTYSPGTVFDKKSQKKRHGIPKTKNSSLRKRLDAYENRIDSLEQRVAILEKQMIDLSTKPHSEKKKEMLLSPENFEIDTKELLRTGIIHSINVEYNEVRIDPVTWLGLTLEQKQGLIMYFSAYFDSQNSSGRVKILSSRNDKKLGSYSVWTGIKIIE